MVRVLVVEETNSDVWHLQPTLQQAGYEALSIAAGQLSEQSGDWSLIVVGELSDGSDADSFLKSLLERFQDPPCVVVTGDAPFISGKAALRSNIAGCVPVENIDSDLVATIRSLLGHQTVCYTIANSPELLPLIVAQIRQRLEHWPFADPNELVRVTVALSEALDNALFHGNLDLSSDLRQGTGQAWRDESVRRRTATPYQDRRVRVQARISKDAARIVIADEGSGFSPDEQFDCRQSHNLERCSGRGLFLMSMYMDDIDFNETGNEITLTKRHPTAS